MVVQGAREGWPRFVGLCWLVRGSIAKVHHSRRAGSSGTNEMMICRLMMFVWCAVVVIGWLNCGVPIWLHVTACHGTVPRTTNHLQARLEPGEAACDRRRCGVLSRRGRVAVVVARSTVSQPAVVAVAGIVTSMLCDIVGPLIVRCQVSSSTNARHEAI